MMSNLLHGMCPPVHHRKSNDKENSGQDVKQGQGCAAPEISYRGHLFYCMREQLMLVRRLSFLEKQMAQEKAFHHTSLQIYDEKMNSMPWPYINSNFKAAIYEIKLPSEDRNRCQTGVDSVGSVLAQERRPGTCNDFSLLPSNGWESRPRAG